jgi:two-component system cell cycle response regulator
MGELKGADWMNKKILTIDDSKTLRMIVSKHLAPFGIEMLQAENGEEGIMRARATEPDVILLDYNMPVMDGYHTLVKLKTDPDLKKIPVVMLTTETVKETVVRLVKMGLKDYIAKPFTREVLLEKLNPILGLYDGSVPPLEKQEPEVIREASRNPDKPTILAVDDKTNILALLKEYLADQFNVLTIASGKAALRAVEGKSFDYLFLDLSMPDINTFDILQAYLRSNRKGANVRKVVAMTLRTAESDIKRAMDEGIVVFLYKPFGIEDAAKAGERITAIQKERTVKRLQYLAEKGKARVLECPAEKSSKHRAVAAALSSEIIREIDDMAEEGLSHLVIKVGEGFLTDLSVTRKLVDLVDHAHKLSLDVRFVADSEQARETLKMFEETASVPTDTSLEFALNSMG